MPRTFRVLPLDPAQLNGARRTTSGVILDAKGGEPLRCCFRDAVGGGGCAELILLFNYQPPLPADSPYQERGAVFAHARQSDCRRHPTDEYPAAWRGRPQVLRAYDARGFIHPSSCVHEGRDCDATVARVLAHPDHERDWRLLLDAGVDHINTDDLAGLERFLSRR